MRCIEEWDLVTKSLILNWPPGYRCLIPRTSYLEALVKVNVTIVYDEINRITNDGLVDDKRKFYKIDIIVCATGFNVSFKPSFRLFPVDNVDMNEEFEPHPNVYLAMAVPNFSNYFTINGVKGNWAAGTALNAHEACVWYILQYIHGIQYETIGSLEVRAEPLPELYKHQDEWFKGSVFTAGCKK